MKGLESTVLGYKWVERDGWDCEQLTQVGGAGGLKCVVGDGYYFVSHLCRFLSQRSVLAQQQCGCVGFW